jgi:HEAT repeat protein
MSESGAIRIRTTKDIVEALRSADPGIRFSILRAIIQHPEQAAAYGASEEWDLVEELCDQTRNLTDSPLRTLVHGALVSYKDPRVKKIFIKEIHASENAETLTLAARYLAGEVEDGDTHSLSGLLQQNNSLKHAQAAADVMMCHERLSDRERVRIAMLSSEEFAPPGLTDKTEQTWTDELHGPYATQARRLIEAEGETAFLYLRKKWNHLEDEDRKWLLEWGAAKHPAYAVELILLGLDSGSDPLVLAALQAIAMLGEYGKIFTPHTGRHLKNRNPAVRLAAARAGAAGVEWETELMAEDDTTVKIEMLRRLAEEKGALATPALVRLIEEGDWRLRAAATSALQRVSGEVAELMKPLMTHPRQAVQVAAAQVLIAAGEELWLEEQLLA